MNFISILWVKRVDWYAKLAAKTFLVIVIFCAQSCGSKTPPEPAHVSKEERVWLTEFFRDLLFKDGGIYTLCGTKPISISIICKYKDVLTQEEQEQFDRDHPNVRRRRYDYEANYEKWLNIKDQFHITQYLFGEFPAPFGAEEADLILFVNIEMALKTLLTYYSDFRRILERDFDPFQVVFELENRDSPFWNAVLKNHALTGLLLGYGLDNSWFFQWKTQYEDIPGKEGDFMRTLPSDFDSNEDIENYDARHFTLPIFRTFGLHQNTELIKRYQKEREQIRHLYKGKNEVDVTLEWLTR